MICRSTPLKVVVLFVLMVVTAQVLSAQAGAPVLRDPDVSFGDQGISQPVILMHEGKALGVPHEKPIGRVHPDRPVTGVDSHVQNAPVTASTTTTSGLNFLGLGVGFTGFSPDAAPPDTNGAVGATQFVEWVNESFAVFDKTTGGLLKGPIAGNQLFQALGASHPCAINNDGDPIAQYDKANNRWIMTQFSVTNGNSVGYWQCVAVSQTNDATGAFNVYAFQQPNFND